MSALVETLSGAFFNDPVWGWAYDDPGRRLAQHTAWFEILVGSSLGVGGVWTTPNCEAVAVWIPPGAPELTDADAARLHPVIEGAVGPRSALIFEIFDRFGAAHPTDQEHYYLSLFGTHPQHRGAGIGMQLLAANLAFIDEQHMPAFLESTNNANIARYESVGFDVCGRFELPADGPDVTMMWRDAR
jgi:GNAT superfamily N-acetyltransferase